MSERLFHRELSWIEFNKRVMHEMMRADNPLLERLKFAGIVSSNFDEFFMVRAASLEEDDPNLLPVYRAAFEALSAQNRYFVETLYPEMQKSGIHRIEPGSLNEKQLQRVRALFENELLPLLTPIALRENTAQPLINLSLYLIVKIRESGASGERAAGTESTESIEVRYAVVEIPKNMPRMIVVPSEQGYAFVLLEDIVAYFARDLFHGYDMLETGFLRITRAAEMTLNEEKDEDFANIMSDALHARRLNDIMRLEIIASEGVRGHAMRYLGVSEHQLFEVKGWMDLKTVSQLAFQPGFENLKNPAWSPIDLPMITESRDMWELIKEKDIVLHHPYESFEGFIRFLQTAATDPHVLAIKQTLYRTAKGSMVDALVQASQNGKQVTVLVEIKARFDEESNIAWAKRLQNAGATVLYGIAGLKTHAKACLVIRSEAEGIKRYVHLSTGNYNQKTAKIYSDLAVFSANNALTRDITAFFNVITGYSQPVGFSKIHMAPFQLRNSIQRLIERETMRSTSEKPGLIIAKMNSLVDKDIIELLYAASQAGVKVQLNVRGICCLRPGVPGMSENIEVTSIVDMFLEHSRIFYFENGGDPEVFLSSADWMPRNLDRRIEIMFPLEDEGVKRFVIRTLHAYFKDNTHAWKLQKDGSYRLTDAGEDKKFRVQEYFQRKAVELERSSRNQTRELRPQTPKH